MKKRERSRKRFQNYIEIKEEGSICNVKCEKVTKHAKDYANIIKLGNLTGLQSIVIKGQWGTR